MCVFYKTSELRMESLVWDRGPPCTYVQESALKEALPEPRVCGACITATPCKQDVVCVSLLQVNKVPQGRGLILVNIFMHSGWISVKAG